MKHSLLSLAMVILSGLCYAQEDSFTPPDYDQIEKNINDVNSEYYMPRLLVMIDTAQQTLNMEHYRHLYYGQVFNEDYNPYQSDADDALYPYYKLKNMSDKENAEFIALAPEALKKNPIDLRAINFLGYVYHKMGNEEMANKLSDRFFMTLSAILSRGNGETCETAYHILYVSHEYVYMNIFDFDMESQSLVNKKHHSCDYLKFLENPKNVDGVYFNIDKPFGTLTGF